MKTEKNSNLKITTVKGIATDNGTPNMTSNTLRNPLVYTETPVFSFDLLSSLVPRTFTFRIFVFLSLDLRNFLSFFRTFLSHLRLSSVTQSSNLIFLSYSFFRIFLSHLRLHSVTQSSNLIFLSYPFFRIFVFLAPFRHTTFASSLPPPLILSCYVAFSLNPPNDIKSSLGITFTSFFLSFFFLSYFFSYLKFRLICHFRIC